MSPLAPGSELIAQQALLYFAQNHASPRASLSFCRINPKTKCLGSFSPPSERPLRTTPLREREAAVSDEIIRVTRSCLSPPLTVTLDFSNWRCPHRSVVYARATSVEAGLSGVFAPHPSLPQREKMGCSGTRNLWGAKGPRGQHVRARHMTSVSPKSGAAFCHTLPFLPLPCEDCAPRLTVLAGPAPRVT